MRNSSHIPSFREKCPNLADGPQLLAMCPASPDVVDSCEVGTLAKSASDSAELLGSVVAALSNRRDRIEWLEQKSTIDAEDESLPARFLGFP